MVLLETDFVQKRRYCEIFNLHCIDHNLTLTQREDEMKTINTQSVFLLRNKT